MAVRVLYLLLSALLAATVKASVIEREAGGRVVGGYDAGVGQFRHQALVVAEDTSIWAGSLVTATAVLGAAFCTVGHKSWTIRLGGIHRTAEEATAWIVESSWAEVHPEYDTAAYHSADLAVIFLPQEAPLNRFINLVALPSPLEVDDSLAGRTAVITGWGDTSDTSGRSELLKWAEVTIVPNDVCSQFYESGYIIDSTLCAGNLYTGTCWGDTGSALLLETESGYRQVAVASFNPGGPCEQPVPAAYVRVAPFLDWITATAAIAATR